MPTIFDIAKKANVSIVTVSRLLNNPDMVSEKTASKIYKVIDELNFQPNQNARSLIKKRTNTIGVIMPDIKNPFFNIWFRLIEEYASAHGFNLLLCNTDENPDTEMKYIKLLQSQRVDGLIIAPNSKRSVEYLLRSNINFILFDRLYKELETNFVSTNHFQGAYEATEYLIKLGHSKIAILRGPGILYSDCERYSGFEKAMAHHKLPIDYNLMIDCEFNELQAYKATKELLKRTNKPSVIFAFNSVMAEGVLKCLLDMNVSIPHTISLISFDNSPCFDVYRPKITYVSQPVNLLASNIITAIIEKIKNTTNTKETKIFLKPKLIIGESVKILN